MMTAARPLVSGPVLCPCSECRQQLSADAPVENHFQPCKRYRVPFTTQRGTNQRRASGPGFPATAPAPRPLSAVADSRTVPGRTSLMSEELSREEVVEARGQ